MNTKLIVSFFMMSSLLVSSCVAPTSPTKQTGGAVLGGVLGGALGSQVGGGKGRTAAIVAGTLIGALIGGAVGSTMDAMDQQQATRALESTPTGQTVAWKNPDTNAEYEVTPTKTYQKPEGGHCRDYETVAVIDGRREVLYGTACRQPDGSWQSVNN